ncbi:MAG: dTMP kinase [Rhodospirillales bacterium]|nr:dTMP kinase [Rhodospirillales bacterium]
MDPPSERPGRGRFITLEGGEGAGKSTQVHILAGALRRRGLSVVTTREPGGAPAAEEIRALLVGGAVHRWSAMTETLLHYAARREHLDATILPMLAAGAWVICDRFADSTTAYQGYGHGLGRDAVRALHDLVVGAIRPDLTLILDIPVEEGLARACRRASDRVGAAGSEDRYERMDRAFHERVRHGFLAIAEGEPERCIVVDANRPPDRVAAELERCVLARLTRDAP